MDCTEDRGAKEKMKPEEVFEWANAVAPKVRDYVGYAFERNMGQMAAALAEAEREEKARQDADWIVRLRKRQDSFLERMGADCMKVGVAQNGDGKVLRVLDGEGSRLAAVPDVEEALALIDEQENGLAARERPDGLLELLPNSLSRIGEDVGVIRVCRSEEAAMRFLADGGAAWPAIVDMEEAHHEA